MILRISDFKTETRTRLDKFFAFVLCVIGLTYCVRPTLAQCLNDLCVDAVTIDCQPTSFSNYDCTIYDFQNSGMSRLVGNCNNTNMSNCGGNDYTSIHTDLWFGFYLEAGWYDLSVFTDYSCTVCSPSGTKGVSVFIWYTDGSCEDAVISYARNCPGAACWSGNIGEVVGEVSEYGPQDHSLTIEFLSSGQYYIQVQAWGWGPNHPDFWDYSKGSGTISICPTTPLCNKPILTLAGTTLTWTQAGETGYKLYRVDLITYDHELIWEGEETSTTITETGYYYIWSDCGGSNFIHANIVQIGGQSQWVGVDVLGRQGVRKGIKFDY